MWLNYHHLLYFREVAKEGSIAAASRKLHVGAPSISAQLKQLERALGEDLFARRGRQLELTDAGRVAAEYADDIVALGRELVDALHGRGAGRASPFRVGVADVMPKAVAYRLLEPALALGDEFRLVCAEGHPDELLARLALHKLDVVLSDAPIPAEIDVRAFNHVLGSCGVSVFATGRLARRLRPRFPDSLDGAPMLLPGSRTALRRALEAWFDEHGVRPRVVGEFDDGALLKVFGQRGHGVFAAPSAVERLVTRQYSVRVVGRLEGVVERFYAITGERRIQHPGAIAIVENAQRELFGGDE